MAKKIIETMLFDIQVPLSKAEVKTIINNHMCKIWQEYWDRKTPLYPKTCCWCNTEHSPKEENGHLKKGHTGLNQTLNRIGKHPNGLYIHCNKLQSVKLIDFNRYDEERKK